MHSKCQLNMLNTFVVVSIFCMGSNHVKLETEKSPKVCKLMLMNSGNIIMLVEEVKFLIMYKSIELKLRKLFRLRSSISIIRSSFGNSLS